MGLQYLYVLFSARVNSTVIIIHKKNKQHNTCLSYLKSANRTTVLRHLRSWPYVAFSFEVRIHSLSIHRAWSAEERLPFSLLISAALTDNKEASEGQCSSRIWENFWRKTSFGFSLMYVLSNSFSLISISLPTFLDTVEMSSYIIGWLYSDTTVIIILF